MWVVVRGWAAGAMDGGRAGSGAEAMVSGAQKERREGREECRKEGREGGRERKQAIEDEGVGHQGSKWSLWILRHPVL